MRSPALRDVVSVEQIPQVFRRLPMRAPTIRDVATVIFRHRTLIITSFLAILIGVVVGTWLLPKQYEAEVKILVKRERPDPIMTSDRDAQSLMSRDITAEDLNSEVELLRSRDLLEKVVVACGLQRVPGDFGSKPAVDAKAPHDGEPQAQDLDIAQAVGRLERALLVEVITKSKLISVRYTARDPRLAAKVLQTLLPCTWRSMRRSTALQVRSTSCSSRRINTRRAWPQPRSSWQRSARKRAWFPSR